MLKRVKYVMLAVDVFLCPTISGKLHTKHARPLEQSVYVHLSWRMRQGHKETGDEQHTSHHKKGVSHNTKRGWTPYVSPYDRAIRREQLFARRTKPCA